MLRAANRMHPPCPPLSLESPSAARENETASDCERAATRTTSAAVRCAANIMQMLSARGGLQKQSPAPAPERAQDNVPPGGRRSAFHPLALRGFRCETSLVGR